MDLSASHVDKSNFYANILPGRSPGFDDSVDVRLVKCGIGSPLATMNPPNKSNRVWINSPWVSKQFLPDFAFVILLSFGFLAPRKKIVLLDIFPIPKEMRWWRPVYERWKHHVDFIKWLIFVSVRTDLWNLAFGQKDGSWATVTSRLHGLTDFWQKWKHETLWRGLKYGKKCCSFLIPFAVSLWFPILDFDTIQV